MVPGIFIRSDRALVHSLRSVSRKGKRRMVKVTAMMNRYCGSPIRAIMTAIGFHVVKHQCLWNAATGAFVLTPPMFITLIFLQFNTERVGSEAQLYLWVCFPRVTTVCHGCSHHWRLNMGLKSLHMKMGSSFFSGRQGL